MRSKKTSEEQMGKEQERTDAPTYLYFDSNGRQSTLASARQRRHVAEQDDEEAA